MLSGISSWLENISTIKIISLMFLVTGAWRAMYAAYLTGKTNCHKDEVEANRNLGVILVVIGVAVFIASNYFK